MELRDAFSVAFVSRGIEALSDPVGLVSYVRDLCDPDGDAAAAAFVRGCDASMLEPFLQAVSQGSALTDAAAASSDYLVSTHGIPASVAAGICADLVDVVAASAADQVVVGSQKSKARAALEAAVDFIKQHRKLLLPLLLVAVVLVGYNLTRESERERNVTAARVVAIAAEGKDYSNLLADTLSKKRLSKIANELKNTKGQDGKYYGRAETYKGKTIVVVYQGAYRHGGEYEDLYRVWLKKDGLTGWKVTNVKFIGGS